MFKMIGTVCAVLGYVIILTTNYEATQLFAAWLLGCALLAIGGTLQKPTIVLAAAILILTHPQTVKREQSDICPCQNTTVGRCLRDTSLFCACHTQFIGAACSECAVGVLEPDKCGQSLCKDQYMYPWCTHLLPGYSNENTCKDRFETSCRVDNDMLNMFPFTYPDAAGFLPHSHLRQTTRSQCLTAGGQVYCDKCKEGYSGRFCCPDGLTGENCTQIIDTCTADGDYDAVLRPNELPDEYWSIAPIIGDSCGSFFMGNPLCESGLCGEDGRCFSKSPFPEFDSRCICDKGVGPGCYRQPCYGGTLTWLSASGGTQGGVAECRCNNMHRHLSSNESFCQVELQGECAPGLYGDECKECACRYHLTKQNCTSLKRYEGVYIEDPLCKDTAYCTEEWDTCDACNIRVFNDTKNPPTQVFFQGSQCRDIKPDLSYDYPWII